jgi:hypothetical protein
MARKLEPLTREQRIKIYKKALSIYKTANLNRSRDFVCDGMCSSLDAAMARLDYSPDRPCPSTLSQKEDLEQYFPELASFHPGRGKTWYWDYRFWFTRHANEGGITKRIEILTALAEGKSNVSAS